MDFIIILQQEKLNFVSKSTKTDLRDACHIRTMKKSVSTQSFFQPTTSCSLSPPISSIRRNISAGALPDMSIVDAMIVAKAPIYHGVQCVVTTDFPKEVHQDFMHCLVTPYDLPEETVHPRFPWERSIQEDSYQEKYAEWFRRIRKSRRSDSSN